MNKEFVKELMNDVRKEVEELRDLLKLAIPLVADSSTQTKESEEFLYAAMKFVIADRERKDRMNKLVDEISPKPTHGDLTGEA